MFRLDLRDCNSNLRLFTSSLREVIFSTRSAHSLEGTVVLQVEVRVGVEECDLLVEETSSVLTSVG